ncbi:hypothetical protein DMC30DRAFT_413217 [Rhodotorula diobovata]|uniref:Autophagy-related protein 101 n=1 Tax=Rhodotorula diobovata TaxID=5288 RepID=A0A5C5G9L8_9BASI|nr:hypothetical protein DMC30DRAFT_413217 [Rhodotorula diobovata]
MAPAPAAPAQPEVFQASIAVERSWLREVVRAVLGTILFHRVCGNLRPDSLAVASVTFPTPAEPELEELIAAKVELLARVLLDGAGAADAPARRAKLYVSLYPTPLPFPPPASSSRPRRHPTTPLSSGPRAASPAAPSASPTRRPGAAATLAQAAPAAVSSALGWFSASARAALSGGGDEAASEAGNACEEGQEDEVWMREALEARGARPWEGWCVEFELHDFVLRSLEFVMLKTAHVPPITTTDRMPYGVLILVDPRSPPFNVPKAVVKEVEAFPALHKALVGGGSGERERRAASVASKW